MPHKLQDLIDIKQFQELQDRLNEIYSFPSAIIDNEGKILTATAWQDVCTKFHRVNKESEKECIKSDQYIISHINEANPAVSYRCPHGLIDNATPIIIDGVHYGNFFTGQFFLETPDLDFFRRQARKFGYDETAYLEAVKKVPVWTMQQLESYLFFIKGLIEVIAGIGLKNLRMLETKKQIAASEYKYRNLVETCAQPIFTINSKGVFLFMNTSAAQQMGGKPEDFVGKTMWALFPPDLAESQMKHVLQAINSGQLVETIDETIIAGQKKCYTARLQPLQDETGICDVVLAILSDVTERVRAEQALEETSGQLQAIYDSLVDGMLIADAETTRMMRANASICAMFGYSEKEFVGKLVSELHPPESMPQVTAAFNAQLKGEKVIAENLPCKRKDGSVFYADIGSHPVTYNGKQCLVGFFRDISERKRTEEALRESEAKYRFLVENITDVIWRITPNLRFVYCSPVYEAQRGYRPEEVEGRSILDFMKPESAARIREHYEKRISLIKLGLRTDKDIYEVEQACKDGRFIWTEVTSFPIYDQTGQFLGFQGVTRDITERKLAEEKLREKDIIFSSFLEYSPMFVFFKDKNIRAMQLSKNYEQMLGMPLQQLIGKSMDELFPSELAHKMVQDDRRVLEQGKVVTVEETFNGRSYETTKFPIMKDGVPYMLAGLTVDITERKQAEQAVRDNARRMQALYGSMTELVVIHELVSDANGTATDYRIVDCNPAFTDITGITKEHAVGGLASQVYGTGTAPYLDIYARVVSTGDPIRFETYFEPMKKHFTISAFAMGKGMFATVANDVTEQKTLAEQVQQKQKMDAIGQLAGGVAHDYNNQLAVIMGYADMLISSSTDPDVTKSAQAILDAAICSKNLTCQLLAYSRKGKYLTTEINLHRIISETVEILYHTIDKRIAIKQYLNAENCTILGDPTQIQNAILNLSLNARDAMPNGGEIIFTSDIVELDDSYCRKHPYDLVPGKYIRLSVTDTGVGMTREIQAKIFDPFFTTKEVGKGTGMGLASVYGIVKSHKGAINVYSEPGKGSSFTLYFPFITGGMSENAEPDPPLKPVKGTARILLVDDESAVLNMVETMLVELGYQVTTKTNGKEALEYYKSNWKSVDLVLLDMVMPELSGRETFIEMKKIHPNVKTILSSGYSINGEAQQIFDEGVIDFIQKPYHLAELSIKINKALNR